MSNLPPIGGPPDEAATKRRRSLAERMAGPKPVIGALIVGVAVWFILANTSRTRIHFWVVWVSAPLWGVLVGTFVVGMLFGFLLRRRTRDRKQRR